jgi:hypothetical protein
MRRVVRSGIGIALGALLVAGSPASTVACVSEPPYPEKLSYARGVAFEARLTGRYEHSNGITYVHLFFRVLRPLAGDPGPEIRLRTSLGCLAIDELDDGRVYVLSTSDARNADAQNTIAWVIGRGGRATLVRWFSQSATGYPAAARAVRSEQDAIRLLSGLPDTAAVAPSPARVAGSWDPGLLTLSAAALIGGVALRPRRVRATPPRVRATPRPGPGSRPR